MGYSPVFWMARMAGSQRGQAIPTQLSRAQFEAFVLPHFSRGSRGPAPKLGLHKIFNYILRLLYMGCQWKELPIEKDGEGRPEIHHTRIYSAFRRWDADGCMDAIFTGSVLRLRQDNLLDITVIHGDGTTTAAKKGGDNIGFSGHKKVKGDKVVAFCERNCNVIAPFVSAGEPQ
jgi:transposase